MAVTIDGTNGITNVNGSATTPAETGTDTDTGIYYGTNTVSLATGGTQRFTIDSSGNVGIGQTSPTYKLDVNKGSAGNIARFTDGVAQTLVIQTPDASGVVIKNDNDGYIAFSGSSERMRITSTGNVGIGTSSPAGKLDVSFADSTACIFRSSGRPFVDIKGGVNNYKTLRFSDGANDTYKWDINVLPANDGSIPNAFQFFSIYTASAVMTITQSGDVLVGTTSASNSGANTRMQIAYAGGGTQYGLGFRPTTNTTVPIQFGNASGTTVGTISQDASNVAYNTSSDYRLKENIAPMTGALAKVAALKPCTYNWKLDGSAGQGFIAHELAEVCPQAVTGKKDAVDENGKPVYQGVDTSFLVATLTAAIQELKAEFDAYKAAHP